MPEGEANDSGKVFASEDMDFAISSAEIGFADGRASSSLRISLRAGAVASARTDVATRQTLLLR